MTKPTGDIDESEDTVATIVRRLEAELRALVESNASSTDAGVDAPHSPLRDKIRRLVTIYRDVRRLGVTMTVRDHGFDARAGRKRILAYLQAHPREVIDGVELEVVSGISEYARRIRELRKEKGYQIATGDSPDPEAGIDLKRDQYMLVSETPDTEAAQRWRVANEIRKRKDLGSRDRIREYLLANVGHVVTTEELAYVAQKREFARRTRELRTEQGYAIATRFTGRPDLAVGQYVLESKDRIAEPHDRNIPEPVQKAVYERDMHTCRMCGWNRDKWRREAPRILELHHVEEHAAGGHNTPENLVVLCSRCHDEIHAGRLELPSEMNRSS